MIAQLRGTITETGNGYAVIDVNGVGYLVFLTDNNCQNLIAQQKQNGEVQLLIETHVREDNIALFGFLSQTERNAFRNLSKVQGVGNKLAMAILQTIDAQNLAATILTQDKTTLTRTPGVGGKLAARIITELKDKADTIHSATPLSPAPETADETHKIQSESLSALVNLGYDKSAAYQAVAQILQTHEIPSLNTAECIRLALQRLAPASS